ncbi:NLI interacting factor-like phosphatase-domain-containing protein [Usnea florida]
MNSLNILSARVIGPTPPQTPTTNRSRSYSDSTLEKANAENKPKRSASQHVQEGVTDTIEEKEVGPSKANAQEDKSVETSAEMSEKVPLLAGTIEHEIPSKPAPTYSKICSVARRLVNALTESLKWILSTLTSPGLYVITGFYDERGRFSPLLPLRRLNRALPKRNGRKSTAQAVGLSGSSDSRNLAVSTSSDHKKSRRKAPVKEVRHKPKDTHSFSPATSESEADAQEKLVILDMPADRIPRLQTSSSSEDAPQARRSVRIKLYNEDTTRRRKQRIERGDTVNGPVITGRRQQATLTAANIKSPTSPASSLKLTKYPRAPAPPRPLIPRRQPSYSTPASSHSPTSLTQKTLVIDLDETLIHSLAKGGRMSSGHMVEVKLNTTVGYGGATLGPQHPILYYVHKRPHCDDFLRKVCKWYKLVVFTASVQEYADPVIDWLEQERKYFSARYYRQHCTFRNGAYIKDLSSVEPDLSKVMILDNSPLSYIFHEDNAIPIEGWINDPTDNDLLHLIPVLEALQYVIDVRTLLALRRGEVEASH